MLIQYYVDSTMAMQVVSSAQVDDFRQNAKQWAYVLIRKVVSVHQGVATYRTAIRLDGELLLAMKTRRQIDGLVTFYIIGNVMTLSTLTTRKESRGCGEALLIELQRIATERDLDRIVLTSSARAVTFYQRYGFVHLLGLPKNVRMCWSC
jgi:ribosomal protein S18 acetylase RimI-like enzyme